MVGTKKLIVALALTASVPAIAVEDACDGGGPLVGTQSASAADATTASLSSNARVGEAVAMGDVDGDGQLDLVMTAPEMTTATSTGHSSTGDGRTSNGRTGHSRAGHSRTGHSCAGHSCSGHCRAGHCRTHSATSAGGRAAGTRRGAIRHSARTRANFVHSVVARRGK